MARMWTPPGTSTMTMRTSLLLSLSICGAPSKCCLDCSRDRTGTVAYPPERKHSRNGGAVHDDSAWCKHTGRTRHAPPVYV